MSSIFESNDYRTYIKQKIAEAPKAGYGQSKKLSEYLKIHTTLVSQILKGLKSFTPEQTVMVADYFALSDLEAAHLMLLVQLDRAGNERLRRLLRTQIEQSKAKSKELSSRLRAKHRVTEHQRALFYSDWIYSAIRQLTAIQNFDRIAPIAASLDLSTKETKRVMDFLLQIGLCVENKGRFQPGPSTTHLESSSPWISSHHKNWRLKAIETLGTQAESALHYTGPMTLSKLDALKIREMLSQLLERLDPIIEPSASEELHCLNIDWFKIGKPLDPKI